MTDDVPPGLRATHVSIVEAARQLGVSRATISKYVNNGTLVSRVVGQRKFVAKESIKAKLEGDGTVLGDRIPKRLQKTHMTIRQVADETGYSRTHIFNLRKRKMLEGVRYGKFVLITIESVDRFLNQLPKDGVQ